MDYFGFAFLKIKIMIEYYKNKSLESLFYINEKGLVCLEEWKDVVGYEGFYQVSNLGRLKGVDRILKHNGSYLKKWKGKIMSLNYSKKKRYVSCCLRKEGGVLHTNLHRLVGILFIPNPLNLPQVNHKKGIKWDNRASELEWNTAAENSNHALENNLYKKAVGEDYNRSKLTEQKVLVIRRLYQINPLFNRRRVAEKLDVSYGLITMVIQNKIWNHV
jgi:hypothetical protein